MLLTMLLIAAAGVPEIINVEEKVGRVMVIILQRQGGDMKRQIKYSRSATGMTQSMALQDFFSIEKSGSVWLTRDYSQDRTVKYRSAKVLQAIDCSMRTTRLMSYVAYDAVGAVVFSDTIPEYLQKSEPVVPGSVGEQTFYAACDNPYTSMGS